MCESVIYNKGICLFGVHFFMTFSSQIEHFGQPLKYLKLFIKLREGILHLISWETHWLSLKPITFKWLSVVLAWWTLLFNLFKQSLGSNPMRLCQRQVALLVPDVSLLCSLVFQKIILFEQNEAFLIRDKYSHLAMCLHLIQPHCRFTLTHTISLVLYKF